MAKSKSSQRELKLVWQAQLAEYITSIACANDGRTVVASSAAGEVAYWENQQLTMLLDAHGASVDSLSFDASSRYLAAGGQMGDVRVWDCGNGSPELLLSLAHKSIWVDSIAWHPHAPYLAFATGRFVQIWDIAKRELITTLDFDLSTVFDLAWHPAGTHLAVAGNLGARIWQSNDWDEEPEYLPANNALKHLAWSIGGDFLAGATLDRCLVISAIEDFSSTWTMRGFPARIQQLAWIDKSQPTVAAISAEMLVSCAYADGTWQAMPLEFHRDFITTMSIHPKFPLIATASVDGEIAIWEPEMGVIGSFNDSNVEFTRINWHSNDRMLVTGNDRGEVKIWG
ncbi:WD40 repeat domain-containing protein [Chamaesiphon polymorphus]|uniref:Uncharacterized protein n=1 Tax=Chamaesiphon polymorphus CCALA 037 TaxID=2107692 RepID=A0A2T1GAC6_9CYAN|nr:DUF1513 domain-containing protein [Chamaesiphon polymorphus]PSB54201.1 hypothetical protein C7B77_18875 [Chamaesiphon polymorphus CCALA 037]